MTSHRNCSLSSTTPSLTHAILAHPADMGGAACVLSSMLAISKLKIPINMVVCIPLTENMPSGKATKPGDIIVSMAGKTIEVDNTDAEGKASSLHTS